MSEEQEMHFVTADEIDAASDVEVTPHFIKEFGGYVRIRPLDTDQVREFGKLIKLAEDRNKRFDATNWLAAQFMVDENEKPLYTPQRLKSKKRDIRGLNRVVHIGQHRSGMSVKAFEEMEGELEEDPFGDSPAESLSELEGLLE